MSAETRERDSIFRREALEHSRAGSNRLGGLLRLTPRWMDHAYRLLAVLALAGVAFLCLARSHDYAAGAAVVRSSPTGGWDLLAAMPGPAAPALRSGQAVNFRVDGFPHAYVAATVTAVEAVIVDAETAGRRLGPGVRLPAATMVLIRARLATTDFVVAGERRPLYDGLCGDAQVRTGSRPLVAALLPGLRHLGEKVGP